MQYELENLEEDAATKLQLADPYQQNHLHDNHIKFARRQFILEETQVPRAIHSKKSLNPTLNPKPTEVDSQTQTPRGPCTQIVYTLAPKCLNRDYFKAKVHTIWVPWILIYPPKSLNPYSGNYSLKEPLKEPYLGTWTIREPEVPRSICTSCERLSAQPERLDTQRTQYPLIKEYTLNNRGLNIMI